MSSERSNDKASVARTLGLATIAAIVFLSTVLPAAAIFVMFYLPQ